MPANGLAAGRTAETGGTLSTFDRTSMSSPHVAGVAALLLASGTLQDQNGDLQIDNVDVRLRAPRVGAGSTPLPWRTLVAFDGSGSSDPDGDPLSYLWNFGDGGSAAGVSPDHAYASGGSHPPSPRHDATYLSAGHARSCLPLALAARPPYS